MGYRKNLSRRLQEQKLLDTLGDEIAAALYQFLNNEELRIARALDRTLAECMRIPAKEDAIKHFLNQTRATFRVTEGHIRIKKRNGILEFIDGFGAYANAARIHRPEISHDDASHTAIAVRICPPCLREEHQKSSRPFLKVLGND